MIAFLRGVLVERSATSAFIDVGGVGYEVVMPQGSLAALGELGTEVRVLTFLQVREDAFVLYGFATNEERALFLKLVAITGIGPKVALSVLSFCNPPQLSQMVASQDVAALSKVPGIGKKTASRIILELKGSLEPVEEGLFATVPAHNVRASLDAANEALLSMGFTSREAECALSDAPENADEAVLVQHALKKLGMQR